MDGTQRAWRVSVTVDQRMASFVEVSVSSSLPNATTEHRAVGRRHEMCRFEEAAKEEDEDEEG